jgi:hypothetical protein
MIDEKFEKNIDDVEDFEDFQDLFGIKDEELDDNEDLKELSF